MAHDRTNPSEQIPEADLRDEQQAPLDPQTLTYADTIAAFREAPTAAVDEADRLEQHTPVLGGDEDDYPHEASGDGRA